MSYRSVTVWWKTWEMRKKLTCSSSLISIVLHSNPAGKTPGSCLTSAGVLGSSIGPSSIVAGAPEPVI